MIGLEVFKKSSISVFLVWVYIGIFCLDTSIFMLLCSLDHTFLLSFVLLYQARSRPPFVFFIPLHVLYCVRAFFIIHKVLNECTKYRLPLPRTITLMTLSFIS